ncbi:serine/threonine-protein kinase [Streptomyces sp. CS014]|uniref:serine/threonine-protein kinase n=1 Tax=Streptomyces sp. CS014 TaxID=2162707 RepID=UPI000D506474|nr:serine/threonine-protein kinase [Streptomyces sp. CS014]PVC85647.1 serine/threonine protein kinase [Streptomyces sp. CS014]
MTLQDGDPRSIGAYTLEDRLGAGGMGVVYRGRSLSGRLLAIKVIRPELAQDPSFRGRFRREVAAARRVSGAFTAPVVDADAEGPTPWLATLFVPGPSLAEQVARQGALPAAEVLRLAAGLAEALRDIHRAGLVHRDLKPGNVLLAEDGPRVIDFGIARASDATQLTQTGSAIGTPPFMAPEQFRAGTVGPAADVFALGSVLVHAATGHGPFDGDTAHSIGFRVVYEEPDLAGLPDELRPLVTECLAKDPDHRPTPELLLRNTAGIPPFPGPAQADPRVPANLPRLLPAPVVQPAATEPSDAPPEPHSGTVPDATPAAPGPRAERSRRKASLIAAAALAVVAAVTVPLVVSQLKDRDLGTDSGRHGSTPTPAPTPDSSCATSPSTVRGSGSSSQSRTVTDWIADYRKHCPEEEVTYEGSGAGAGILDFSMKKDTEFVLLNEPMTAAHATWAGKRCGDGTLQIPVTTMPVAVVFTLPGVDSLVLDADAVAGVFSGRITQWNDPMIARLNRTTPLPDTQIRVFHHRGVSPSTLVLSHFLAGAAPEAWPYRAADAMPVKTGDGLLEEDIVRQLAETEGALSYLPLSTAQANKVPVAHLDTGGEEPVYPDSESLAKGAEQARRPSNIAGDFTLDIDHATRSPGAYPVLRFGYAVACPPASAAAGPDATPFLRYALSGEGQLAAERNGQGRLPSKLRSDILRALAG